MEFLNKQLRRKSIRFILVNGFKLHGWSLWLAIKVVNVLIDWVVLPFINHEKRKWKKEKIQKKKVKMLAKIEKTTTEHNLIQRTNELWKEAFKKEK